LWYLVKEDCKYIDVREIEVQQAVDKEIEKKHCKVLFILHHNFDATNFG